MRFLIALAAMAVAGAATRASAAASPRRTRMTTLPNEGQTIPVLPMA